MPLGFGLGELRVNAGMTWFHQADDHLTKSSDPLRIPFKLHFGSHRLNYDFGVLLRRRSFPSMLK